MPRIADVKHSKDPGAWAGPQATPNPVPCREGRGVRHFDCPHYDDCLDKAAKGLWAGFTCAQCVFYMHGVMS